MQSRIKLQSVEYDYRSILELALIDYFSEIYPSKIKLVEDKAVLDYPFLDSYWQDGKRNAFFIQANQETVGFILVNDWIVDKDFAALYSVAEFYIKPLFRRVGIGSEAVKLLFSRFPGKWEVRQSARNERAIQFWRSCISAQTNDSYSEAILGNEVVQCFVIDR